MQAQVAVPVKSIIQMPEYHLLEAECQTPLKQAHSFFFLTIYLDRYSEPEQTEKVWRAPNWAFAYKNN